MLLVLDEPVVFGVVCDVVSEPLGAFGATVVFFFGATLTFGVTAGVDVTGAAGVGGVTEGAGSAGATGGVAGVAGAGVTG
ncbi:MAG: hypothetical protein ABI317_17265, partial [Gaiellales bacterium]